MDRNPIGHCTQAGVTDTSLPTRYCANMPPTNAAIGA
jgi:hypothetical protein